MTMERGIQYLTIVAITILAIFVHDAHAHGRMVEPPSRSSMWNYGFGTPVNYNANQLFCGGYDVQWNQNGGRCGICGDPYNGVRQNETGGKYATGTISRHYVEGQKITVTLDITANHGGYFEFRMCPNNNTSRPAPESCLNQHLLRQPNGETKWRIPQGTRKFSLNLVLPRGLTCTQCVMQWKWTTATNWGCDVSNNCCKGCGPQETFMGCSDVAITSASSSSNYSNGGNLVSNNTHFSSSNAISGETGNGFVPINSGSVVSGNGFASINSGSSVVVSTSKCEATAAFRTKYAYADSWCRVQCMAGNCPVEYCQDGCRQLYG